MAETRKDALAAFDGFVETWGVKYEKAVECLTKDREALLAFYDFPAEHWKHLSTAKRHRECIRDRASPHRALQGMSLEQDRAGDDLRTRRGCREELAPPRRLPAQSIDEQSEPFLESPARIGERFGIGEQCQRTAFESDSALALDDRAFRRRCTLVPGRTG
jgi:hypothetical protein